MIIRQISGSARLLSALDSAHFKSGSVLLLPGEIMAEHSTGEGEEAIVIMSGTAKVTIGGESRSVRSPAVVLVPPNTPHGLVNEAPEPLSYVYIVARK